MSSRPVLILLSLGIGLAGAHLAMAQQADPFAQADCEREFVEIRDELEKRGRAVQKAGEGKASAQEACRLLRQYTTQEARLLKFFTEKQEICQIPGEVIKQAREGHSKAIAMRNEVCKVAAAPKGPPPPPPSAGLSGAIGGGPVGGAPGETGGGGVFDTLTGNILQQQ